jgi:hypothetical protein
MKYISKELLTREIYQITPYLESISDIIEYSINNKILELEFKIEVIKEVLDTFSKKYGVCLQTQTLSLTQSTTISEFEMLFGL